MRARILLLLIFALPWSAQADSGKGAIEQRGAELLQPFKKQLMSALKQGLQKSPAEAVDVCHLQAPGIPDRTAPEGVELGRTSHKLRNPDNAPTDWQRELVQYYRHHEDRSPRSRKLDDGRVAYAEPIEVKPLCVTCHGPREQIPDTVRAKLDAKYPEDEATGFEVGDFRGIFWATWPDREGKS
jgi:hypothetical protein